MSRRDIGLLVAGGVFALDQLTKLLLLYGFDFMHLPPGDAVPVLPFFNLVMVWNSGISFGLFQADGPEGTVIIATVQLLIVCGLGWWLCFTPVHSRPLAVAQGLVIGGALGNLVDRLVYGNVADFFHFFSFGYNFYVFNVADTAITFGVLGLIYDAVLKPEIPGSAGKKE